MGVATEVGVGLKPTPTCGIAQRKHCLNLKFLGESTVYL